jgi:hypothetical protein
MKNDKAHPWGMTNVQAQMPNQVQNPNDKPD